MDLKLEELLETLTLHPTHLAPSRARDVQDRLAEVRRILRDIGTLPSGKHLLYRLAGEARRTDFNQSIRVGRQPDINDLSITAPGLSREHFRIDCERETCLLSDSGSSNGTVLNGTKIQEPIALVSGDQIHAGGLAFIFIVIPDDEACPISNASAPRE